MGKDNKPRYPRPMGITQMVTDINKSSGEDKKEKLDKLLKYMINLWVVSNGTICGVPYSKEAFSSYLGVDVEVINNFMRDRLLQTRIWDKDSQEKMMESLVSHQILWTMEDRMEVQGQLDLLKRSQGGEYKAFISGEVNKALKLRLESTTSLQSLIRGMSGNSTVNIFNPVQNNLNVNQGGVTYEEALSVVNEALAEKSGDIIYLEENYDMVDLPVVRAIEQSGVDTSKEGTHINKHELNEVIDNYKLHTEDDHHDRYREDQQDFPDDYEDLDNEVYTGIA